MEREIFGIESDSEENLISYDDEREKREMEEGRENEAERMKGENEEERMKGEMVREKREETREEKEEGGEALKENENTTFVEEIGIEKMTEREEMTEREREVSPEIGEEGEEERLAFRSDPFPSPPVPSHSRTLAFSSPFSLSLSSSESSPSTLSYPSLSNPIPSTTPLSLSLSTSLSPEIIISPPSSPPSSPSSSPSSPLSPSSISFTYRVSGSLVRIERSISLLEKRYMSKWDRYLSIRPSKEALDVRMKEGEKAQNNGSIVEVSDEDLEMEKEKEKEEEKEIEKEEEKEEETAISSDDGEEILLERFVGNESENKKVINLKEKKENVMISMEKEREKGMALGMIEDVRNGGMDIVKRGGMFSLNAANRSEKIAEMKELMRYSFILSSITSSLSSVLFPSLPSLDCFISDIQTSLSHQNRKQKDLLMDCERKSRLLAQEGDGIATQISLSTAKLTAVTDRIEMIQKKVCVRE